MRVYACASVWRQVTRACVCSPPRDGGRTEEGSLKVGDVGATRRRGRVAGCWRAAQERHRSARDQVSTAGAVSERPPPPAFSFEAGSRQGSPEWGALPRGIEIERSGAGPPFLGSNVPASPSGSVRWWSLEDEVNRRLVLVRRSTLCLPFENNFLFSFHFLFVL